MDDTGTPADFFDVTNIPFARSSRTRRPVLLACGFGAFDAEGAL